ncbi:uncharacterized protein LOC118480909 [Helianthus annuus]|uniref:uncharacterized protein LOC118480909 n=1 Tax=Helianthus annuus TaxID=4232 RepID=UPI0016532455|nr:uncharacterized protein LOC118480909 [Helianthus annuus]
MTTVDLNPLSPLPFLLVMEALSNIFVKAGEAGLFKGFKTPNNGPKISHLFYADDALILGERDKDSMLNVARFLRIFYMCSGLKLNLHKSNLVGLGVEDWEINEIAKVIGCEMDNIPLTYLGITVGTNMNKISNWNPVIEVFDKMLSLWKSKTLSIGGGLL